MSTFLRKWVYQKFTFVRSSESLLGYCYPDNCVWFPHFLQKMCSKLPEKYLMFSLYYFLLDSLDAVILSFHFTLQQQWVKCYKTTKHLVLIYCEWILYEQDIYRYMYKHVTLWYSICRYWLRQSTSFRTALHLLSIAHGAVSLLPSVVF